MKIIMFLSISIMFLFFNCGNVKQSNNEQFSEWRDNNGIDSASFYPSNEACNKIIGKLKIKSRLHKNLMDEGVFGGGMSSRWYTINEDSIKYYNPNGVVADHGECNCENGILKIDWKVRFNRRIEYIIHFNSENFVELRYYDYPFSFDTFTSDTLKKPNNPTKVIGVMEREL
ncbi:hypothetical protein [Lacinutrix mariniflava]|uniref:hypothetical protein n=1 Tax=Lacinutrix mariniflava TaxID=342955 RepID=UPI000A8500DA|nr:hypothetical protein [Lacinutrix mariniflava]